MTKFRMSGSFAIEVEAEDSDAAYDIIHEKVLQHFFWDNVHDFGPVEED